ncbi:MAG: deoxynucleoside kinase [Deltaproteobacteria bacterium]|nr:deoxynucleoside kinase [Deltaproteobacteria bacterium]
MPKKETPPPKYIAIDGPIGVGKTTLVKRLAEELGGTAILEPEEQNPFLTDFYKDRKKNAFKTQLYFLLNRYQQQKEIKNQEKIQLPLVCDYTFAKDQIFAKINLNAAEEDLYQKVYALLDSELPKPDIVVYLRAKTDVLLKRIKSRSFDYEKPITGEYLDDLMNAYNECFLNYNNSPLLIVDTTNTDFLKHNDQYEILKNDILNHRQGTKNLVLR